MSNKNALQIFENEEFGQVRTMIKDGEPWFVGKDVAKALGYSNVSKAVSAHVDEEDKQFMMMKIASSQNGNVLSGATRTAVVNESGLYSLIFGSKLEKAKEFKRWVTSEVLPSIRKTGSYNSNQMSEYQIAQTTLKAERIKLNKAKVLLDIAKQSDEVTSSNICRIATEILTDKNILWGREKIRRDDNGNIVWFQ